MNSLSLLVEVFKKKAKTISDQSKGEGSKAMRKYTIRVAAVAILVLGPIVPGVWSQNTVQTIGGGGPNNLPALRSGMGYPMGVALDGAGNLFVADIYSARIFRVATTGNVTVVAGNGARGFNSGMGDGIPATSAYLAYPTNVATDSFSNILVLDSSLCEVRKVSAQTGNISTVVGSVGNCRYSGDGGPAASATLDQPHALAVDKFGNIFVGDTCAVREVSAQTGNIFLLAGMSPDPNGIWRCGYSGDGGLASNAKLGLVSALAVDGPGNIYIADTANCVVRAVSASTGIISTVAGSGSCGYSGDGGPATSAKLAFSNGLRDGLSNGITVDGAGNLFIADTGNCVIREVFASNSTISTVAGTGSCGYSGDGGPATSATLYYPPGVAVDRSGNILVADYYDSVIREVSASTGKISTFAGVTAPDPKHVGQMLGFPAYSGDGYLATDGQIGFLMGWSPGMTADAAGNLFIADAFNNAIRRIDAATGIMTTVAGNGFFGFSGDGGPATSAELFAPRDVAFDATGNLFIMDTGNCVVRKVSAATGIISTVAGKAPDNSGNYFCDYSGDGGPATDAQLYPIDGFVPGGGIAVDIYGNLFIADTGNKAIRKVSAATGIIKTVAGMPGTFEIGTGDGGPATSATLAYPYAVAVDKAGNIFIADTYDNAIREVVAANGYIYTVAGNIGLGRGFSGDGGPADGAQVGFVFGLFLDPAGNLFIPDTDHCVIRKVAASSGVISSVAGTPNPGGIYYCGYGGDGGPASNAIFDNPTAVGAGASGNLIVLDDIRVRSVDGLVQESGAGSVAFPSALALPGTLLGTSSTRTVVLSNRGSVQTSVFSVAISGTNASDFTEADKCVSRILAAGGDSCVVNVNVTPSTTSRENALLTINDTAGVHTVDLSGAGLDFSVTAANGSALSQTVVQGQGAVYYLQVSAIGGMSPGDEVNVNIACAGAPTKSTCSFDPQQVVAEVRLAGALSVYVLTTAPTQTMASPINGRNPRILAGTLPVGVVPVLAFWPFVGMRRSTTRGYRRLPWLVCVAPILYAIVLWVGCGGGGTSSPPPPPPPTGGTPPGTYTLTLTATSGGISHTTQLTLVVNALQ